MSMNTWTRSKQTTTEIGDFYCLAAFTSGRGCRVEEKKQKQQIIYRRARRWDGARSEFAEGVETTGTRVRRR